MGVYAGISEENGELVIGDMFIEVTVSGNSQSERIAIFDYDDFAIHPVAACVRLFPNGIL
jgi:hypothetical protein